MGAGVVTENVIVAVEGSIGMREVKFQGRVEVRGQSLGKAETEFIG